MTAMPIRQSASLPNGLALEREARVSLKRREGISPEALSRESAAKFFDCSVSTFDQELRPFLPVVEITTPNRKRPLLRWMKRDLLAFLEERRRPHA